MSRGERFDRALRILFAALVLPVLALFAADAAGAVNVNRLVSGDALLLWLGGIIALMFIAGFRSLWDRFG